MLPTENPDHLSSLTSDAAVASGVQHVIGHGHQECVVTEVGATLRSYTLKGVPVVDGFQATEMASYGRGQVLAPWPNRLGDGRFTFEGRAARAALDEPERRNAIHGLVRWIPWVLVSSMQNVVTLGCTLHPQPGYPWRLGLLIEYRLGRDGLTVTTEATNLSDVAAPFGIGFHPYLDVGAPVDAMRLRVPARKRLITDERKLPTGEATLSGTEFDFVGGRRIGPTRLDTAFCDLVRDADGMARVEVEGPGGRRIGLWADRSFGYLMIYTADDVEPPNRRRASLAVEPMTCPPDALRSGVGVIRLEPGERWRGAWGLNPAIPT